MAKAKKILLDKDVLFYSAYTIWFSGSMIFGRSTLDTFLGLSSIFWLKKVCYPICAVLIIMVFYLSGLFTGFGKKQLSQNIVPAILVVLFGFSWLQSGFGTYFMALMFILAAKEINLRNLPRIALIMQSIVISLIIFLALTGKIENVSFLYERMNQPPVYRQALGLRHPNALGAQFVQFCIGWLWIRWKKWKWYDYSVYAFSICFVYTICNSITSVLLIALCAFLHFFYKLLIRNGYRACMEKLIGISIWAVPAVCIFISYFYSETSAFMAVADHLVAWRFKIASWFLQDYPATFLGSRLPRDASSDILYVDIIVRYGCIILFLILSGIRRLMKYAVRENMYPLVISIFIYTLYGITEQCPYQLMYNFTLLYLVHVIYGQNVWKDLGKYSEKFR